MKIKILSIIIVGLFLFTTLNVVANDYEKNNSVKVLLKNELVSFSDVQINLEEDFSEISVAEANNIISSPGKPELPVYVKTYTFPRGTKIKDISCFSSDTSEIKIDKKVKPASNPTPRTNLKLNNKIETYDSKIYSSKELYPKNIFDYKISYGLKNNKNVIILNIYFYPVRYNPAEDTLHQTKNFDVQVSYQKSIRSKDSNDEYDMVIICPPVFKREVDRLADHKNSYGVKTLVKTTTSIYIDSILGKYDERGRDKPEQIKYFIKYAKENFGVDYVLLFGGRVGQMLRWYVPVRYTNLDDGWEKGHLSDLYYSDLYKYDETTDSVVFEDWDSNKNGIFAELKPYSEEETDNLDLYPDINVGRLACRNLKEAEIVVDKIINYEKNAFGSNFFKNYLAVGGDTTPPVRGGKDGYNEGDIETRLSGSYLKPLGFNITELYMSTGNFTNTDDLIDAINEGHGMMHLSGHGNPMTWTNFPPDSNDENDTFNYSFMNFDMKKLTNSEKLPVCVIGACHSSQFDVTVMNIFKGIIEEGFKDYFFGDVSSTSGGFKKGEWVRRCWSWNMVVQENGGSIATIGNTGLGYGDSELNCTERWDGYIASRFFYNYNNLSLIGVHNLGNVHSKTISDYMTNIYVPNENDSGSWIDIKTVEGWALLGDPSLRIGGYP